MMKLIADCEIKASCTILKSKSKKEDDLHAVN